MADVYQNLYNPDVLSCLANLSNDEVFTPPEVANRMLDLLPQELFRSPDTTFLDPACKSGVFLREIAKRLLVGLENEIPDLQQRVDHIFHKQLYGIAITELTSLLSRRACTAPNIPTASTRFHTLITPMVTSNTNEYPTDGQTVSAPFVEPLRANTNALMIWKRTPMSLFIPFDRRIFLR